MSSATDSDDEDYNPWPNSQHKDEEPQFQSYARKKRTFFPDEILRIQSRDADIECIQKFIAEPEESRYKAIDNVVLGRKRSIHEIFQLRLSFLRQMGDELLNTGQYEDAIREYRVAIDLTTYNQEEEGFRAQEYYSIYYLVALTTRPGLSRMLIFLDLVSCCRGLFQAYLELGEKLEVKFLRYC